MVLLYNLALPKQKIKQILCIEKVLQFHQKSAKTTMLFTVMPITIILYHD